MIMEFFDNITMVVAFSPARDDTERRRRSRSRRWRVGRGHFVFFTAALLSATSTVYPNMTPSAVAADTRHIKATAYYYPKTFRERNGMAKPENLDFTKISRVNYASFQLDESGNVWGTDSNVDAQVLYGPIDWNPPSNAKKYCHFASSAKVPDCQHHDIEKGLIRSAHSVGTRVYATIGGPDFSDAFSMMAADTKAREEFAERCALIIKTYNFDGIDIDWRFPDSTIDMANYSLLLSQIRDELDVVGAEHGNSLGLTATLPCAADKIPNIDIFFLDLILNELSLLTLDFHGPWDGKVGASAPLYDRVGEQGLSVESCVSTYVDAGASREKINVALPFYGQSFAGAFAIGQEATCNWAGDCSDKVAWQQDSGSPSYFNVFQKLSQLNTTFDNETMATFAFGNSGIVSFDNEKTICIKTEYVIEHELGGVLIFELGMDLLDELSTPLLDAMNLKLLNNDLSCESSAFMESLLRQKNIVHEGRDEPIYDNTIEDAELSAIEFLYSDEIEQEYRYTCGFGEGDARRKCSKLGWQEGLEETICNTGTCPQGQICFLSVCDVIPQAAFTKPIPKGKPKKKPSKMMDTLSASLSTDEPEKSSTDQTFDQTNNAAKLSDDNNMSFSCGVNFQHAESCGHPCPNGLADCPSGQFCFWLECSTKPESAETSGPSTGITFQQYKCGSTRDDALSCGEDCSNSWQCSEGKDCYLVPCSLS